MMSRSGIRLWTFAAIALFGGASTTMADPIQMFFPTGNTQNDLSPERFPNVVVLIDNPTFPNNPTNDVAQADWMTREGWLTGWNFRDIRLAYDRATDTMAVAFNGFKNPDGSPINIAGDADGNGDPNNSDPRTIAAGGIDWPNFGGTESMTIAFDTNMDGVPNVVAGIPANKPGSGLDAFTVARFALSPEGVVRGIEQSFGEVLTDHVGELAFAPSPDHPDLQFTIRNFSRLPGLTPFELDGEIAFSYNIRAYAGSLDDVVAGEDQFSGQVRGQIPIPEPTTLLLWIGSGLGAACLARRRTQV
ncbi:protein of unknown function DUF1555 [Isosphaera pallida ATCC 43644]|uniref:PEP-CTERM protein-sorting domain-containing protein n=2 Tax=Isosphaera pallida TaxID=128 RepID=E8R3I1_ISOPI|nr:protein of unknown function DUF1555 [Isosphaera pallida ATCC 43644]